MRLLSAKARSAAPPGGRWAARVREARRLAQPPATTYNASDLVYRWASIFPSLALARLGVSPNGITLLWIVLGLTGLVALASPNYPVRIAGALLLQVSYLLDFVDGEVARLLARTSRRGYFLDLVGHGVIKAGLFLALGSASLLTSARSESLLLAFVACVSVTCLQLIPLCAQVAGVSDRSPAASHQPSRPALGILWRLASVVVLLFESPGLYAVVLVVAILDVPFPALMFYAICGPLWCLYRIWKFRFEPDSGLSPGAMSDTPPPYQHRH
jgi:phosphatidylglycerophosphate synthase